MSIGIGTLQPRARVGHRIWPSLLLTLFLAIAIVAIATTPRPDTTGNDAGGRGTLANTPTELRGGFVTSPFEGTLANTPTELRGGLPAQAPAHEPIVVNGNVCPQCR